MGQLTELQSAFGEALLDSEKEVPPPLTSYSSVVPRERFNIYRNNVHVSLIETLRARFPVVARLVGDDFFSAMARIFIDRSPPSSPVLIRYGVGFDRFLQDFEHARDLPYLSDVARLEWIFHEAYHAPDRTPLGAGALSQIEEGQISRLCFELHPSLGLLESRYPVFSIWRTNTHDETVKRIAVDQGGEWTLVVRPELEVAVHRIDQGLAVLIRSIRDGAALGDATARAIEAEPDFRFDHGLAYLIDAGGLAGVAIEPRSEVPGAAPRSISAGDEKHIRD